MFLVTSSYGLCDGQCDSSLCPNPEDLEGSTCPAGIAFDECNCCYVCARQEFERCHHPDVDTGSVYHGKCGDSLECIVRLVFSWYFN